MHGRCHAAAPTVCQRACTLRPAGDIASLVAAKGVVGEVKRQRHRVSAQCVLGMLGPLRGSERSPAPCAPDLIQSVPRIVLRYHAVSEPGQGEPLCTCSLRISAKGQACVIGMHRSDDVLCGSLRAASQGLVWKLELQFHAITVLRVPEGQQAQDQSEAVFRACCVHWGAQHDRLS